MTGLETRPPPATTHEIREIIGQWDDDILARIAAIGATKEEVLEAFAWLNSDDYLHRKLHHGLSGRPALVFEILEATLPEDNGRQSAAYLASRV
jgi:hypothetical protein